MSTPLGWDGCARGAGTLSTGAAAAGGSGCWNILVKSPGSPGADESVGDALGAAAGLWNARVNSPGCCAPAGTGCRTGLGAVRLDATGPAGSGAWRN